MNPHLIATGLATLALPLLGVCSTGTTPTSPPNVLVIVCDDLNDWIGAYGGHPQARTPNIDRLAARGVRFTNAQSNLPVCAPSRASFWTGIYPHTSGLLDFQPWRENPMLSRAVTLQEHFRANGYETFGSGKVFHNGHEDHSIYTEYRHEADFGPWPSQGLPKEEWVPHPARASVIAAVAELGLKDVKAGGLTVASLDEVPEWPADPKTGAPGYTGWKYEDGRPFRYASKTDRDPMPDESVAAYAAEVIARQHDKPFLLTVGFVRPHEPLYVPQEYFDLFPLENIQLPAVMKWDLGDCDFGPSMYERGFGRFAVLEKAGEWKRSVQGYLAAVAFVDAQVGKVLDALERSPAAANTIVVLTSDNGYQNGQKRFLFKYTLWEESCRVPLIIVAPATITTPGAECRRPVSLIDLYPTLVDLAGLPGDPNAKGNGQKLEGHSLAPFLRDPADGKWTGPAVALSMVNYWEKVARNDKLRYMAERWSVRSERYRYIDWGSGHQELYDHDRDPHEWVNLAPNPAYTDVIADLRRQMFDLRQSRPAATP